MNPLKALSRAKPAIILTAFGLAAAILVWFRLPPIAHDTLWAEDGRLFLAGAEKGGILDNLFTSYAGYLQFVPRVIAIVVVAVMPVSLWAYGMTAGACLVTGGVAVVVYIASRDVLRNRGLRLILALVVVLVPLGPRDVLGNPTNLHSVLLWMTFWVLLYAPRGRASAITMSMLAFSAAVSEIQVVFLVPLMPIAAGRKYGRYLVVGPALGVACQLVATVVAPRAASTASKDSPASMTMGYLINAVTPNFLPQSEIGAFITGGGLAVAAAGIALLAALVLVAWRTTTPRQQLAMMYAALLSLLVWTASVVDNPAPYYDYASLTRAQLREVWLTRYGVVPAMMLFGIAIVAADALLRSSAHSVAFRALAVVTAVTIIACLTANYLPTYTRRSAGPTWSTQIASAQRACARSLGRSAVELNETLGWHVPVDCKYLEPSK